ncbi:MAG: prepilin-type N-terminal cleavage/methylation domain-containing protein [Gemmatimonadota bacterium]
MRHHPNDRRGFTLIELLIVVVIIGILAAIAIPKFSTSKEKAIIVKMKGDLRNLITSQEAYITDNPSYYAGAIPSALLTYNPSLGVSVVLVNVTSTGWGATASAVGTTWTCGVFVGTGGPAGPAVTEGVTACIP